jgi:hypothetical protein
MASVFSSAIRGSSTRLSLPKHGQVQLKNDLYLRHDFVS